MVPMRSPEYDHEVQQKLAAVLVMALAALVGGCTAGVDEPDRQAATSSPENLAARVEDSETGLTYSLPEGWIENDPDELLDVFTSSATSADDEGEGGGLVATGPLEGLFAAGETGLADQSEAAAIDFAEFFVPFEGTRDKLESEAIRVGGHAAHRTQFRIEPDEERDVFVEAVVIDLGDDGAFALGLFYADDTRAAAEVEQVLASLSA